jgi:hypothetical protein
MPRFSLRALVLATVFAATMLPGTLAVPAFAAAPTIKSFSPTSGTIGTDVTIIGSGFTGGKTVGFDGSGSTFKVVGDTKIIATAPANVVTGTLSVTTLKGTGHSAQKFTVLPGAQLSPASGQPATVLTLSAAGFHAFTAADIYFDTADQALATTNAKGAFSMRIQVPTVAQPGTHWLTVVARGSNVAVQQPFVVSTNWLMAGLGSQGRSNNEVENTLGTSNVSYLRDVWTKPSGGFANPSPFVVMDGSVYVGDVNGVIHAYSSTGALLWQASPGVSLQSVTPVAVSGRVFFGASNGNVYAYTATCRKDGGICTPLWTKSVGTNVSGSLKFYQGKIYAPSSDGSIHVLSPENGAAGTPIFGIDITHGPVTTAVVFAADGTFFYGAASSFEYRTANGSSGVLNKGATVSNIAVNNGAAYFTTGDGKINEFGAAGWSAATSGTGCAPTPAIADNLVYAGGCTSLAAFEAGRGTLRWSLTTAGPVFGLSVANGVLYACVGTGAGFGGIVIAYDASFGSVLWSGGQCIGGGPEVVNGTVYAAFASITASRLPGFQVDAAQRMPAPRKLRPDYRLAPGMSRVSEVNLEE